MTNLTREETVWLQAYCAAITSVRDYPTVEASDAVKHFKEYFPTPTAEDKQAVVCEALEVIMGVDNTYTSKTWAIADEAFKQIDAMDASEGKGEE